MKIQLVFLQGLAKKTAEFDFGLFSLVKEDRDPRAAVAGGISLETLPAMAAGNPSVVIVGSAVTGGQNPKEAASAMRKIFTNRNWHVRRLDSK